MRLEVVKRLLESNKVNDAVREVERLQSLLRMTVNDLRRMIFDLRPALLQEGLEKAMRMYAERFQQAFGIPVLVAGTWSDKKFDHAEEISLFRIFQELLNNVHKHAQATEVRVEFYRTEGCCGFRVQDNGRGFNPSAASAKSFGYQGMQERISFVQGHLRVTSVLGQGTCVECEVPIRHD